MLVSALFFWKSGLVARQCKAWNLVNRVKRLFPDKKYHGWYSYESSMRNPIEVADCIA